MVLLDAATSSDPASAEAKAALAWLKKLESKLLARAKDVARFSRYYEGDHPLLFASEKFREAFGGMFLEFADNWCDLVVDATEERLSVVGFRFGDSEPSEDAWRIWQTNHLDADSKLAHLEALVGGTSYALVWNNPDDDTTPLITVEHPAEMIVATASGNRRRPLAALKRWYDAEAERLFATVYLPDAIWKFQSGKKSESEVTFGIIDSSASRWQPRYVNSETWPLDNPLERVPVVELANRPRMVRGGLSELRRVAPLQDAVNKLVADMMVASEFGAFRQRWVTGIDIPEDPDTHQPIEPFKIAVQRLLTAEPYETDDGKLVLPQFGEFSQTDLRNFVQAIEMIVQHIASQTRTPPHYFYLKGQFPSGESIKSAETGLVAKVNDRMIPFGEAWEEVMRLSFAVIGNDAASIVESETIWRDPESRSESEHIDALLKQKAFGIPEEILWEKAGYSPTEIKRIKAIKAQEVLLAPEPPATPPAPPVPALPA